MFAAIILFAAHLVPIAHHLAQAHRVLADICLGGGCPGLHT